MGLRWPVMGQLRPGLPCTSQHVYTPRVYYNHWLKQKQNISFELVAKKKASGPSLSQRETHSDRLSHTAAESNNRLVEGETQQKMTGDKLRVGKKAHIFSRAKAWESAPLYLCFSVSGRKSPSHNGGQVYWALDEIRKTVGCMWSKSEFCLSCDGFHASVSGGCSQALLVDLTPADGPFKVGETRTRESKGKKATKTHKRQTDGDKKKEVLWCLVYIPQPSCLKYSKICNLYNHPVQIPANNPLSHKQTAGQSPAQVLTSISSGDKWSKMAV